MVMSKDVFDCCERNSTGDAVNVARGSACQSEPVVDVERLREDVGKSNGLLLVSTLDGKFTVLTKNEGRKLWSVETAPGPLLSSNIHRSALTYNGQIIRMIPSLSGILYGIDSKTNDLIAITVDNLLSPSFKFSDDLVISGGKETRLYRISLKTGQKLYEYSLQGCLNMTDAILAENADAAQEHHDVLSDDEIIIRRTTQTVRAIELHTGNERWYFSVGDLEVKILKSAECQDRTFSSADLAVFDDDIKLVGLETICSVRKGDPNNIRWSYQFDHYIVKGWQSRHDNLKSIDFFQSTESIWNSARKGVFKSNSPISPSIYLGTYQTQDYIQDSPKLQQLVHKHINQLSCRPKSNEVQPLRIPGKLYPVRKTPPALLADDIVQPANEEMLIESHMKSLSGFYIFEYINGKCDGGTSKSSDFTSRLLTDFDLVQCLGKGAFGVVFEAKNKIDDVNYAIKRICLPNKKESRDRVMREVKTLANCEHHNIVRYFQAWVENPPPGWQECEDRKWLEAGSQSYSASDIETPDCSGLPQFPSNKSTFASESASKYHHGERKTWTKKLEDSGFPSKNHFNKWNGNYNDNDDDCSFIEFRNSDDESPNDEDATNNSSHCDSSTTGSCNRRGLENGMSNKSDSFEIEFKHSTHNEMSNNNNYAEPSHIISKDSSAVSGPRKRGHARPLSLDLSIKGSGIKLEPPKTSSKVYLYIQMQLCQKQSLRDWLQEHKGCKRKPQVDKIFSQIVDAVEYIHQKRFIHRDLKPSNIFFSLDGQIKIGDFGLVTDMKDIPNIIMACGDKTGLPSCSRHTQQVGTYLYMSPEQLQGKSYNFKVDIFAIGLIFFELLVDFGTEMERTKTLKSLREGIFPSEFQKPFQKEYNLLKMMLSENPNDRPDTFKIKECLAEMKPQTISLKPRFIRNFYPGRHTFIESKRPLDISIAQSSNQFYPFGNRWQTVYSVQFPPSKTYKKNRKV